MNAANMTLESWLILGTVFVFFLAIAMLKDLHLKYKNNTGLGTPQTRYKGPERRKYPEHRRVS